MKHGNWGTVGAVVVVGLAMFFAGNYMPSANVTKTPTPSATATTTTTVTPAPATTLVCQVKP